MAPQFRLAERVRREVWKDLHEGGARASGVSEGVEADLAPGGTSWTMHSPRHAEGRRFVGRLRELRRLERATHRALEGNGALFLLTGEPGIGKSRLAEEAGARAETLGATLAQGRCWDAAGAPAYWPWIHVVRALGRLCDRPLPQVLQVLSAAPWNPEATGPEGRPALFEGIGDALREIATSTPLVLVLDDLHAADVPSLELLRTVGSRLGGARLLILGTYREAEATFDAEVSRLLGQIAADHDTLRLRGLGTADIETFVRLHSSGPVDAELPPSLRRRTGGNPFFLEEILARLGDTPRVRDVQSGKLRIPAHVQDLIAQRLSQLPDSTREILATAAVIGPVFDLPVVAAVTGQVTRRIRAAEQAGIVKKVSFSPARYAFAHDLFRDVLYRSLPAGERLELHRSIGEALESDEESRDSHADVAHHFTQAAPVGGRDRALLYSERAGREEMEHFAWESAARHFERALALAELPPVEPSRRRCEILLQVGEATWAFGAFERSKKAFREAARLAEEASDPILLGRAALGTSGHSVFLDMGAGGVDEPRTGLLAKTLDVLPGDDSRLRARLLARLCAALSLTPAVDRRRKLAEEAVDMARRLGDADTLADVLHATSWGTWGPNALAERLRLSEEVLELATKTGRPGLAMLTRYRRLHYFLEAGDASQARKELETSRAMVDELPHAFYRWLGSLQEALWASFAGDFEAWERHSREALAIGQEEENPNALRLFGIQNVFLLRELGRLDEIVGLVESVVSQLPDFTAWRSALTWIYTEVGRNDAARRELDMIARDDFLRVPRDLYWLASLWGASEACLHLQDRWRAEVLYERLLPYADRCLVVYSGAFGGSVARLLGSLAAVIGRFEEAESHFADALRVHERMGARTWTAHTLFDQARACLERNRACDRKRADEILTEARRLAGKLGMLALERRIAEITTARDARRTPARRSRAVFRLEGEFWTILWQRKRVSVPDSKGLRYLATLLANPGHEIHVLELAGGSESTSAHPPVGHELSGVTTTSGPGDAGELLDPKAEAEYRERIRELERALEEGDERNTAGIREEITFLSRELSASRGLGGRRRKAADAQDRARKAVTSRIRQTLRKIAAAHPGLGHHFSRSVRLGLFCSYEPKRTIGWEL